MWLGHDRTEMSRIVQIDIPPPWYHQDLHAAPQAEECWEVIEESIEWTWWKKTGVFPSYFAENHGNTKGRGVGRIYQMMGLTSDGKYLWWGRNPATH
jgi:hypothetical protein